MLPLLRGASVCLALFILSASPAIAQELAPEPVTTPPVAEQSTDVPYPEGASGDAEVELELVVEADGTVSSATVSTGSEPFAERAREAALTWRFSPATRDGVDVAARIRARVAFRQELIEEPPAVPPPEPSTPAEEPKMVPPVVPEEPIDVTVRGARREVGETTLTAAEVRQMPGAFGDPFRAIEPLPGVTPFVSGIPYFYIRGAPPNDNGYYVDGIRVPLLFHVGVGEGVIHPGLIERIEFFPSVAPARYGGFAGATVAGHTREPSPEFRGEANLRLIDAGALLEAPFGDGGSALVAGRYGYPGPVVGAFAPDVKLDYWDYQARASVRISEQNSIGVFAFGSHDYFATGEIELQEQLVSDFHRVDLRFDHDNDAGRVRFAVTGGYDSQGADPTYVTDRSLGARLEVDQELSPRVRLRAGASGSYDDYSFEQRVVTEPRGPDVPSSNANPPPTNLTLAAHADAVLRIGSRLEVTPGARFGLFRSTRSEAVGSDQSVTKSVPAVDPRLAIRFAVTPKVALLTALGLAHQFPTLRVGEIPAAIVSVPGFPFGTKRLQRVAQASQGIEILLPAELVLTATGFASRFWGLTDLTAECYQPMRGMEVIENPDPNNPEGGPWVCPNDEPVNGLSFGGELLLQRPITERVSGLLSYTLSRSTRKAHFVDAAGESSLATVPSENDRTHVFNAVLGYELGRRWRAGGRFVFFTGSPYSKMDGNIPIPPYNSERFGSFYRFDVRLEKSWPLGDRGSIAFVVEGLNVTANKQSAGVDCEGRGMLTETTLHSTMSCRPAMIGPITIPSIGVEAFF